MISRKISVSFSFIFNMYSESERSCAWSKINVEWIYKIILYSLEVGTLKLNIIEQ